MREKKQTSNKSVSKEWQSLDLLHVYIGTSTETRSLCCYNYQINSVILSNFIAYQSVEREDHNRLHSTVSSYGNDYWLLFFCFLYKSILKKKRNC